MIVSFSKDYEPWRAASEWDGRPLLTGVKVDRRGFLIATNTNILALVPCEVEGDIPEWDVVIPAHLLKLAHRSTSKGSNVLLNVDLDAKQASVFLKYGELRAALIEGRYPPFEQAINPVLESEPSGDILPSLAFNPLLMVDIAAAIGLRKGEALVQRWTAPNAPVLVLGHNGAFGAAMPMQVSVEVPKLAESARKALITSSPELAGAAA